MRQPSTRRAPSASRAPGGAPLVLRWSTLAVVTVVGVLVVFLAWLVGPGLFGVASAAAGPTVAATVTGPAGCVDLRAQETVQFELGGQTRNGTLNACGHSRGEQVSVIVPDTAGSGLLEVRSAEIQLGHTDLRRPVGLVLLSLSVFAGAVYAFLIVRGPRRRRILV